jgi:hypothetical protein
MATMIKRRKVVYEWDIETLDGDDIIDHHHFDYCPGIPDTPNQRLVLVKDVGDSINGLTDRLWAYAENGKLPDEFEDAYQIKICPVPKRFHKELAKSLKT